MTVIQLGIGTANDIVDAPHDAGHKAGKPIPAGLVHRSAARALALACFAGGVALAGTVSSAIGVLGIVVVAIGLAYDLGLKGTAWSWLPFAVGIPILPVYGWLGATGTLHPIFAALVPAAVLAGAALAIANALVDVERDLAVSRTSIAARLGRGRASALGVGLLLAVEAVAVAALDAFESRSPAGAVSAGAILVAAFTAAWASDRPARAEWSWRIQAVSLGVAGIAFLAATIG
jgi:4-hydroxybenzoate polyprenyltransferase